MAYILWAIELCLYMYVYICIHMCICVCMHTFIYIFLFVCHSSTNPSIHLFITLMQFQLGRHIHCSREYNIFLERYFLRVLNGHTIFLFTLLVNLPYENEEYLTECFFIIVTQIKFENSLSCLEYHISWILSDLLHIAVQYKNLKW